MPIARSLCSLENGVPMLPACLTQSLGRPASASAYGMPHYHSDFPPVASDPGLLEEVPAIEYLGLNHDNVLSVVIQPQLS